jgi:glycogenin glucosyltransferase
MVLKNWSYELLPTNVSSPLSRKSSQWRFIITGSAIIISAGLIWSLAYIFWPRPPYSQHHPRNIQPLVHSNYSSSFSSHDQRAVVSSLYSDSYAVAVAVLGHSIHSANVRARLIIPYLKGVSPRALFIARSVGWEPEAVPFIPPPHNGKDIYYRFVDQYSKLNIWSFDKLGVDRLVYLDADTLVRRNFDELFDSAFNFAAVPDVWSAGDPRGFSITFNAGVLALRPSTVVLEDMKRKIETAKYPLGQAEQAFLNLYFGPDCVRLPYAYNANLAIKNRNPELWRGLKEEMRIVHYSLVKPFIDDSRPGSETVLTLDGISEVVRRAALRYNGLFAEEVGWWKEAYERMMQDKGDEIAACLSG